MPCNQKKVASFEVGICKRRGQRWLELLETASLRMSRVQQESDTYHGHMGTNYHLHPLPCACDQDEPVTP